MPRWIYWAGFLAYSLVVIWVGWRGYQKSKHRREPDSNFWTAGKSLNGWSAGLSISASFMSISWSCVYNIQLYYWYGLSALWLLAIPWLLAMIGYFLLIKYFRKLPAFSQPEMLAQRFGERVRAFIALPLAFVFLVWGGAEIYAAAQVLSPIFGVSYHVIILLIALVVAIYSSLGGFEADVATDKVQYALVAFFIIAMAYVATETVLEQTGLRQALNHLPYPPKARAPALSFFSVGGALIALTMIAYLPGWIVETDVWLRLQAAKNHSEARKGVLIAGTNAVLFTAIFPLMIGLAALHLYPPNGTEIPAKLNDGAAILAVILQDHAPAILILILIVGLAAAAMSTIDTCCNVVALSLSYDLLEPHLHAKNKLANRRTIARVMSAGAVVMAYVYALFTESLWDIFYLSSGILTTTIFIPMVALFRPTATRRQAQTAAAVGFVSTFILYFLETKGLLKIIEPNWLAETGLGYIPLGLGTSFLAYFFSKK